MNPRRQQRLSWIPFQLPREQKWPRWNTDDTDDLGPLRNASGCFKVLLGRMVNDLEKAVLLVLWRTVHDLEAFESSFEYEQLLKCLGLAPIEKLTALQWTHGFEPSSALEGRVTLTKIELPPEYARKDYGDSEREPMFHELPHHPPRAYKDPRVPANKPLTWMGASRRVACLWADKKGRDPLLSSSGEKMFCYRCFKWDLDGDRSQEEVFAQDGSTEEQWAKSMEKLMPPVESWVQERWEIEVAPSFTVDEADCFEDVVQDSADEEGLEYSRVGSV